MPKKGQSSVTIRNDIYKILQRKAEAEGKSVAQVVTEYAQQVEVPATNG